MARSSDTDWEGIEQQYRAGIKTLRQIAEDFGISHVAITKRAKRDNWVRDLSAKIAAAVEDKVTRAKVTKTVTKEQRVTENAIVEANAQTIAEKVLSQQRVVKKSVSFAESLLDEAIKVGVATEDLDKLGELMAAPDENGHDKLNELYKKIISMPGRVDAGKKIIEMLKVAVELERKVLRIKDEPEQSATVVLKADPTLSPSDAYMRMIGKK